MHPARALHAAGFRVSIVNAAQVRQFARGLGIVSKTDAIDSRVLAPFGRLAAPRPWSPPPAAIAELSALSLRLEELQGDLQRELNRREQARVRGVPAVVLESMEATITLLKAQCKALARAIEATIAQDPALHADVQRLRSIPAVGPRTAARMLVLRGRLSLGTRGGGLRGPGAGRAPFGSERPPTCAAV